MYSGYIYCIENIVNGKKYIGQTSLKDVKIRWKKGHINPLRSNSHINTYLQRAWNKYGENNFEFRMLLKVENNDEEKLIEELNKLEDEYIKSLKSMYYQHGYNIKEGGKNGKHSIETKLKIGMSNKGRLSGEKNPMYGKTHSIESIEKIKLANKNKVGPNLGKKFSKETREKMSSSRKEKCLSYKENNPMFGKKHSEETVNKMRSIKNGKTHSDASKQKISSSLEKTNREKMKLSRDEVIDIFYKVNNNEKYSLVMESYNISYATVCRIKSKTGIYGKIINEHLERKNT